MKNPKTSLTLVALIIALSAGFGLLFDRTTQKAMAAQESPHHAVVILVGFAELSTGTPLSVGTSQSSAGAPAFTTGEGTNLAQDVADLLAAGFRIEHVDGLTYTLVR